MKAKKAIKLIKASEKVNQLRQAANSDLKLYLTIPQYEKYLSDYNSSK